MQVLFDRPSSLTGVLWVGLALLDAFVIWTLVRAPGRRQDPGLPEHRREDSPPPSTA